MHLANDAAATLVVEDDDEIRERLTELLAIHGYHAVGARGARDGLAQLASGFRPRVMVLDPFTRDRASRYLREIMADPAWENTPVIIGRGSGVSVRPADGLLRRHYLRKPLDLFELFEMLDHYLVARSRPGIADGVRPKAPRIPARNAGARSGGIDARRQGVRAGLTLLDGGRPTSSRRGRSPMESLWAGSAPGQLRAGVESAKMRPWRSMMLLGIVLAASLVFAGRHAAAQEVPHGKEAPHVSAEHEVPPQSPRLLSVEVVPDGASSTVGAPPPAEVPGARASDRRGQRNEDAR